MDNFCPGVGMRFCKVPISGRAFDVMMKLSRWRGPDKWEGFVLYSLLQIIIFDPNHYL
jgi:hypothetical protein